MHHSVTTSGHIADDHSLTVTVPTDLPPGPVKVTLMFEPELQGKLSTIGDLLDSGILGLWVGRDDLPKTNEEFIEWRRKIWDRRVS
ncbi:MAG: hypothetical protein ACYC96_03835 [Fimbriimonadaceae bacterium]